MKIYLAQTTPHKGNVTKNIIDHLRAVDHAVSIDADLVVFPQLSLTGYEPILAKRLAIDIDDIALLPLQKRADEQAITIAVGMPTQSPLGVRISMLVFRPDSEVWAYHKRILHDDEIPYFASGDKLPFISIAGVKISFGICYETLRETHFVEAKHHQADVFIASVAKPDRSMSKAFIHFPTMAQSYQIPIAMVNCVGPCDDFVSNGQSAVWDSNGDVVARLGGDVGYLTYEV